MEFQKGVPAGLVAGLVMGVSLFVVGAFAALAIYGPQFAPPSKFEPEQINTWYFLWTKLVIGAPFGVLFRVLYAKLYSSLNGDSVLKGLYYIF